jgi:hypothetical protein
MATTMTRLVGVTSYKFTRCFKLDPAAPARGEPEISSRALQLHRLVMAPLREGPARPAIDEQPPNRSRWWATGFLRAERFSDACVGLAMRCYD